LASGEGRRIADSAAAGSCRVEEATGAAQKTLKEGPIASATSQIERYRWMFSYRVTGDLRFISHHDTLRLFRRALARADIPVRFSEGFNPHQRMTIPLPRPVGVSSEAEAIVIETDKAIDPADALQRLQAQMPEGIGLQGVRALAAGERPQPDEARYRLLLESAAPPEWSARVDELMASETVVVARTDPKSKKSRSVNIKPYIVGIELAGDAVEFTLRVTGEGSARPAEIAGLLGFDPTSINHRIHRQEVRWR